MAKLEPTGQSKRDRFQLSIRELSNGEEHALEFCNLPVTGVIKRSLYGHWPAVPSHDLQR